MHIHLRHKQQHFAVELETVGHAYRVVVDGVAYTVEVRHADDTTLLLTIDGRSHRAALARTGRERLVGVCAETYTFVPEGGAAAGHSIGIVATPEITAPMPGKVLQVLVRPGDHVAAGDGLLILEAMKMESRLVAEAAGVVTDVRVTGGDMVEGGQVLVVLNYDDEDAGTRP